MNRRSFLSAMAGGALAASQLQAAQPPNIVVILADDLGFGDIGCYGSSIPTPNIDRMAKEGMRFRHFYAASPVCSPSRCALLTGRYAQRYGIANVLLQNSDIGLPPGEMTLAEVLRPAKYATACIGKWHVGDQPKFLPMNQGFQEFFGIPYSHDLTPLPLYRNRNVIEDNTALDTLTARFTSEAVSFIKRNKDRPFFLYLAHVAPHIPLISGRAFRGFSGLGPYGDVVAELDWSVGQVMAALKDNGLDDNSLVIFASDNGPWYEGTPGALRGRKGETWDGGMRVPMIARFPGYIKPDQVSNSFATTMDFVPTFARLVGGPTPGKPLDGVDIWPLLTGDKTVDRDAFLFFDDCNIQAVRSGPWKLHVARGNTVPWLNIPGAPPRQNLPLFRPELYNLELDSGESANVAAEHPRVVADLQAAIDRLLPTFPQMVQDAWSATRQIKVIETPAGSLPVAAPPPPATDSPVTASASPAA